MTRCSQCGRALHAYTAMADVLLEIKKQEAEHTYKFDSEDCLSDWVQENYVQKARTSQV